MTAPIEEATDTIVQIKEFYVYELFDKVSVFSRPPCAVAC